MIIPRLYSYLFRVVNPCSLPVSRRFWTRNRPGDTVLERSEDGTLMHASRLEHMHREELEHERASEETNMPGLGFEGGLLEQLQQQGKFLFGWQQWESSLRCILYR